MDFGFPIIAGTLASILHVISGPDHLAAVTPLAISSQRKGWKVGICWGLGHLLGMLLVGLLFLFFKELIPVEAISAYSEQLVALVLIGVGLWAFFRIYKDRHRLPLAAAPQQEIKQQLTSALGIGVLHGLAGVAHFILLLPVLAFETSWEGVQYILGFALGTVIAMTAYAYLLGIVSAYSKKTNDPLFYKIIRIGGGVFALVIGVYWLYLSF